MKQNKTKVAIISCLMCVVLMGIAVLLPMTLGKYRETLEGYTGFGIANFNAAILPPEVGGTADPIKVTYSARDFQPGMLSKELDGSLAEDTAAVTKFRVANGTTAADAADTSLQYTIRIRTANSLPLKYTLKSTVETQTDDGTVTTYSYYQTLENPARIEAQNSEVRYEYQFDPDQIGTPEGAETSKYREATFLLDKGTAAAPLVYREHELIAEWPAEAALAGEEYMKEVEIVEILVTVVALNKTYEGGSMIPAAPATGLIVMRPYENKHSYTVDLRNFKKDAVGNGSTYHLNLHNGFGFGVTDTPLNAEYTMQMLVPLELIGSDPANPNWSFTVYREDITSGTGNNKTMVNLMPAAPSYYIWRDEKTGDEIRYDDPNDIPKINVQPTTPKDEVEKSLRVTYAVYELTLGEKDILTYQKQNAVNAYEFMLEVQNFIFKANKFADKEDEVAFLNKLELRVDVTAFNPVPGGTPAPQPPAEGGEGEEPAPGGETP